MLPGLPRGDGIDGVVEGVLGWHDVWVEADVWLDSSPVTIVPGPDPIVQHVDEGAVVVHRLPHHGLPQPLAIKLHGLSIWPDDRRTTPTWSRRGELWGEFWDLICGWRGCDDSGGRVGVVRRG